MQFNSFIFILAFLPSVVILYFGLNRFSALAGKVVLIVGGLTFYAYADLKAALILIGSIAVNFLFIKLIRLSDNFKQVLIIFPVVCNIILLTIYKYCDFMITNYNSWFHKDLPLMNLALPLGISFFTFQQIAYLVTCYTHEIDEPHLIDYLVYILYFPKLLMGPLAEPSDFLKKINDVTLKKPNASNIACGIKIFSLGLFKKMLMADTCAIAVNWVFDNIDGSTSMDLILATILYTFQIYYDFSGYCDMATGASLMLNITLPINFDSPYKALSIRDFWKRWHISLTRFLTKYIYIPLGGNRKGRLFTYLNTMIVFLISGIWHGANWTFILWGLLHGVLSCLDRLTESIQRKIIEPVKWSVTFACVSILWLLFRADSIGQWIYMIKKILVFENTTASSELLDIMRIAEIWPIYDGIPFLHSLSERVRGFEMLGFLLISFSLCLIPENNYRRLNKNNALTMALAALAFVFGFMCITGETVFVYNGF